MQESKLSKLERLAERLKIKAEEKRREATRKLERQGRQFFLAEFAGSKR